MFVHQILSKNSRLAFPSLPNQRRAILDDFWMSLIFMRKFEKVKIKVPSYNSKKIIF